MYRLLIILLVIVSSCKSENKPEQITQAKPLTLAEKIANAHGYEHWSKVSEIQFTFNVDSGEKHYERSWTWQPKTNAVTMRTQKDTISYYTNKVDSTSIKADQGFINDKYWALFPFQLVWDNTASLSEPVKVEAPISKMQLNKTTLTYTKEGGYTPGDAYDIFYDDNYSIKEWVFRAGNTTEVSMVNTFENYQDFNGIKIALDHKKAEGNWNLYFSNVVVKME
jgi:hypothetical protein